MKLFADKQAFHFDVKEESEQIHPEALSAETTGPNQPEVETLRLHEEVNSDAKIDVMETTIKSGERQSNFAKQKENLNQVKKRVMIVDSKRSKHQNDTAERKIYSDEIDKTRGKVAPKGLQQNAMKPPQLPEEEEEEERNPMQSEERARNARKFPNARSDEQRLRQITMEEALRKFRYKTSEECINQCLQKTSDGHILSHPSICNITKQGRWTNALQKGRVPLTPFLDGDVYVYPYERKYLNYPDPPDSSYLPSAKKSRIVLAVYAMRGKISTATCKLGGTVTARLDLVDEAGRLRTSGGDEVRAWVGATHDHNGEPIDSMFPRAMASVADLNNGSYLINVSCLWAGRSHLIVTLRYPREFLKMVVQTVRRGLSRFLGARFKKGEITEEVPCLATPNIPGRPCVCNMTSLNGGGHFYCARPLDTRLSCNDWTVSGTMTRVTPDNMADAEGKYVMKRGESIVPTDNIRIFTEPNAKSGNDEEEGDAKSDYKRRKVGNMSDEINIPTQLFMPSPTEPCTKVSRKVSWTTPRPTGYWRDADRTWVSLLCREPIVTKTWMRACLKDSSVWIIGDSNGIRLYYKVADSTELGRLDYGPMPFFDVMTRSSVKDNIQVHFSPHEHPLYVTKEWKQLDVNFIGVSDKIDDIPSKGRQFLIIHYFLHLTPVHLGVAHSRLVAARDAILRLLARNPQAVVAIRGPHTVSLNHDYNIAIGGDSLAHYLVVIIREVFEDLQDRVIFLDGWETSLSLESAGIHPRGPVASEMARKFFSFICDERIGSNIENN